MGPPSGPRPRPVLHPAVPIGTAAPLCRVALHENYRFPISDGEVDRVTEERPTNERLAELLEEIVRELRELKDGQQQLAADVRKLGESSRS